MAETTPGIQLNQLSKSFDGNINVIDHLELEIPAGKFVAVLGPTGCGKTTILRMIGGLESPDEGTITFTQSDPQIAFCFQEPRLLPWRDVASNIRLPLEIEGIPGAEQRVDKVLEMVGLADAATRMPAALSGGMKMRTSLARALVSKPNLLLLDEPFGALDEVTRYRLDEDVAKLIRNRDTTTLLVTHSITEAVFLADEVVVLSSAPAKIVDRFPIEFDERIPKLRTDPKFSQMTAQIYESLRSGMEDTA